MSYFIIFYVIINYTHGKEFIIFYEYLISMRKSSLTFGLVLINNDRACEEREYSRSARW